MGKKTTTLSMLGVDPAFQRFADAMAREAGGVVRVGTRMDTHGSSNSTRWTPFRPGMRAVHHLRVVLPHEIVFDLGDDVLDDDGNHVPKPWGRVVDEAHALMLALNRMGIPYWCALSGGKGIHIHVFGAPGSNPAAEAPPRPKLSKPITDGLPTPTPPEALADAPPCVRRVVRSLGNGKNVPHAGRFLAAAYFHHAGFGEADLVSLFNRTPNFNRRKTTDIVRGMRTSNYLPFSCANLQTQGICHDYIKVGRCSRVSNPVSFLLNGKNMNGRGQARIEEHVESGPADWRNAASGAILEVANAILARITKDPLDAFDGIDADPRLLNPLKDGRLCREFGRRKSTASRNDKLLWFEGPGPFPVIPVGDRRDAYEAALARGKVFPSQVRHVDLARYARPKDAVCPRGPQCIRGHPAFEKNPCQICGGI